VFEKFEGESRTIPRAKTLWALSNGIIIYVIIREF